nr:hypothetical protein [Bradyrhizobium sp. SZCCHNRI3042]
MRINANQSQQRLHNDEPATANGRRGNSTIPDEFIDLGSAKTGRFARFCHSAGQPLRKRDPIRELTLRFICRHIRLSLGSAFDAPITPHQGCASSTIE